MIFEKHIRKFVFSYWVFFLVGILALVMVDWVQLYIPEYLGNVVKILGDGAINNEELSQINNIVIKVIVVAGLMLIGRVIWRLTIFHASQGIETNLRKEMFMKAERLSQRYYHENKVGTVMAWFTGDLEEIEGYFGWGTIMLVDAFFLSLLVIYKMVRLDIVLTVVALVPIILIVIWGALVEKIMSNKWTAKKESDDKIYDFSQENFTGIRVIKAFVKENKEIHAFRKIAKNNLDVNMNFVKVQVLFDVLIEILIALIMALLLGVGSFLVYKTVSGDPFVIFNIEVVLSPDKLVEFIAYFDSLIWPAIALGQIITMRARSKASLGRIANFLDQEEEIKNPDNPIILDNVKGNIAFNNFSFSYPNSNKETLSDISLEIKSGEMIGVVGRIGCGKTTLINSLLRFYNIAENSILFDGIDIMKCDIDSVRKNVAYVPQDNFLFSDSVFNNINFVDGKTKEEVVEAAKFAEVHDNIIDFKDGYDTVTGERGVSLSGGQKQRISIARAFIKNAPIMILDDSVSAVDIKTEKNILANIKKYREGKTTIVVSSRISTVNKLDKIIVLDEGNLVAFDTPDNLAKNCEMYQKMVFLQELENEVEGEKVIHLHHDGRR